MSGFFALWRDEIEPLFMVVRSTRHIHVPHPSGDFAVHRCSRQRCPPLGTILFQLESSVEILGFFAFWIERNPSSLWGLDAPLRLAGGVAVHRCPPQETLATAAATRFCRV